VFDVFESALDSERRHLLFGPSGERANEPLRRGVTLQPSERQHCCAVSGKQVHRHIATFVGEVLDASCGEIVLWSECPSGHHGKRRVEAHDEAADIRETSSRDQLFSADQGAVRFLEGLAAPHENPGQSEILRFVRLRIQLGGRGLQLVSALIELSGDCSIVQQRKLLG
jgi:hypothetical protein